jgi:hypothetical protein
MNKAELAVFEIQQQMYGDKEFFGKSAENPFYKSKYVPLNNILRIIMPKLLAKECKLKHTMEPTQHAGYGLVTCIVTHKNGDTDSSSIIMPLEVHEVSKKGEAVVKLNGQEAGKANTYGRRYSIVPLFAIPEYDDDCEGAMKREQPKKPDPVDYFITLTKYCNDNGVKVSVGDARNILSEKDIKTDAQLKKFTAPKAMELIKNTLSKGE